MPITVYKIQALLKACEKKKDAAACRRLHYLMIRLGYDSAPFLSDHLIRLLGSYGSLFEANLVFCVACRPNVFTWQAIMSAHCSNGECDTVLHLYHKMLDNGIDCDRVLFLCILKACGALEDKSQAYVLHQHIIRTELDAEEKIGNTIVDTYAKCGCLEDAIMVFRKLQVKNVVSWTAVMNNYIEYGYDAQALVHFERMMQSGVKADEHALVSALKACNNLKNVEEGSKLHCVIVLHGLEAALVIGTSLVDMYANFESLLEAHHLFEKLPNRNVVTFNAMITGYCRQGEMLCACKLFESMELEGINPNAASWNALISGHILQSQGLLSLELYEKMKRKNVKPDAITFLCVMKACASIGALKHGRNVHEHAQECGLDLTIAIGNSLVDMYCKCSSLSEALKVLDAMPRRDVVSWGAMIAGFTQHGHYEFALQCFQEMQEENIWPVGDTYTSVLTACRFLNRLEECHYYFKSMSEQHGIEQSIEHFNCMVDLLGRAGRLVEAEEILSAIPILSSLQGWMSLLTASKKFGNTILGHTCFDQVVRLAPSTGSGYALMASIFRDDDKWDEAEIVEQLKSEANAVKKPGRSWIEVADKVHEFCVRDESHPSNNQIEAEVKRLRKLVIEKGHTPQLILVGEHVSAKEEDEVLWGHSERLALAFGLVSTPPGATIRITKNLRTCANCHSLMKIVSKVEKRNIIVRDTLCVHQFSEGECSCMDHCV